MQSEADIQWNHCHYFEQDNQHKAKKVTTVFWLTTIVMIIEITAGSWSGSMALLADGWHMGTHSAAFAITMFAYWYAKKHANNRNFSFGTGKVSYLGGFASAIALAIVALMMAVESLQRLFDPQLIHFNEAIIVAFVGLSVNVASVFMLTDDHHHDHGHEHLSHHHDHNIKAAYYHVLADTLTSVLAILALFAGKYFGWLWMDAMVGIVGAIVISKWSYGLIFETSEVLLDKTDPSESLKKIIQTLNVNKGQGEHDVVINDFHLWAVAPKRHALILSISSKTPLTTEEYKNILTQCLPELVHITVEVNTIKD